MEPPSPLDVLAHPELRPMWDILRQRLERNGRIITSTRFQLTGLSEAEISRICMLLSRRRPPGNTIEVSLADLDVVLRGSSFALGLIDTLETLAGPVIDRRAQRADVRDRVDELWIAAEAHPAARAEPIGEWLRSVRRRGRLTRLGVDDPAAVLATALDFLHWFSVDNSETRTVPRPLAAVAAEVLGDAHALDPETALGKLIEDAVESLSGLSDVRSAWRSFGVDLDNVSTSALCFMLPGDRGSIVHAGAALAEPVRITGRMLDRGLRLALQPGEVVSICENPSLVMIAADRLGAQCGPLVCLEGMPSSVTSRLLRELGRLDVRLRVHADFDFGGISIMNHVVARFGADPWLMGAGDYLAALERQSSVLKQHIGATAWDPELSTTMNLHRRAVHEEAIADLVLASLA